MPPGMGRQVQWLAARGSRRGVAGWAGIVAADAQKGKPAGARGWGGGGDRRLGAGMGPPALVGVILCGPGQP